ncbi:MFS transporter [Mycolicibacterium murale]|uniref:MFS transporter n=1 Tax=Mycolicibacterium murale TaxID=182220 RepID=A0A7I9WX49_9MYCO|nr:MFS transporter [Mycolicibacterium murale]MCV7182002.1 MFS transporter [Mycolicibacterium murale]GFG62302.1 MFS transporter [Mycolicibacterium murale]
MVSAPDTSNSTSGTSARSSSFAAKRRSLVAAGVGNALEWFDWNLYGIFSVYLAANAFSSEDPTSGLLSTLAVFAVGFVARPVGGLLFGRLSDRLGRKMILVVTMCLLAASSVALAIMPTYGQVGVAASVFLLVARLIQGLAHGGEAGVAYTYAAELAPPERRGLWGSVPFISSTIGLMTATASAAILSALLSDAEMQSYGWRIGFAFGGLLGLFALWLRRSAVESDVFIETAEEASAAERTVSRRVGAKQAILIGVRIIMISVGVNMSFYAWISFAPTNAISQHGMDQTAAFTVSLVAQGLIIILLPFMGMLSDKVGRKPMVLTQGILMIVLAFPIAGIVSDAPWTLFVAILLGNVVWACVGSIYSAIVAEQAPTAVRATMVGFVVSLSVAVFGGTAPYLNTWLNSIDKGWVFNAWIMLLGVMVIAGSFVIRETKGIDLRDLDDKLEAKAS